MARVTSKRQVTIPKAVADRYGIRPGDEIEFVPAGEAIRVRPASSPEPDARSRLERFDEATERQQARQRGAPSRAPADRGWRREDLYARGRAG